MKKLFVAAFFALFAVASFAQVSWNAKAGINMSTLSGIKDGDMKMKVGYQFGVGMEYAFNDTWAIQPSLLFITKGAKAEESEDGETYSETYNPMYLQLPIMAAVRFKVSDGMNLVINAGPYLAYGIGGKVKSEYSYEGESESEKANIFGDGEDELDAERFDFGLGAGVTAEFGKFFVGIDGQFGLTQLLKDVEDDYNPKNTTISLSVGYKF